MYDVTIIGAGPAGSTLARLLGSDCNVLLIDKRQLLGPSGTGAFEKCCGGLIAPDAQQMLARMGMGIPGSVLVGPQLFTVRTIDMQKGIEKFYQRHYINVDREKLDRWLVSILPERVKINCGCLFKSFEAGDSSIKVKFIHNGTEYSENTRVLVGADGAFSTVRRQAFPQERFPRVYAAVQEWFRVGGSLPYFSSIFDSEITDFYSWTIPKEDCLLVGAAIPYDDKVRDKFELFKKKLQGYGFELGEKVKTKGAFIYRPVRPSQICLGRGNIALVGEAAGWISPSSAEGMSYSFRSAIALADSIKKGLGGFAGEYRKNVGPLRRNIVIKNLKSPFMYNPLLRNIVMRSGLLSMEIYE